MPLITTKPKGETLFNQFTFSMNATELAVAKVGNVNDFIYNLTNYLDSGHDLTAPISIKFSIPTGSGISTSMPNMEMVCTFQAPATFAHYVAYELAAYDVTDLSFLKDYNIDWNQNFEFIGSYNGFTPFDGTPLHLAAFEATHPETIEFFLEMGAHPNILNSQGHTPLNIAQEIGVAEVAEYIQQYVNDNPEFEQPLTFAEYLDAKLAVENELLAEFTTDDVLVANDAIPGLDLDPTTDTTVAATQEESSYFYQAYEAVTDYFSSFFTPAPVDVAPVNEVIG